MNEWWSIDDEILACLSVQPLMTPAEIAGKLGLTPEAAASLLAMLAAEGRVRIRVVERADRPRVA